MFKRSTPVLASLNQDNTIAFYTEKLGFSLSVNNNGYLIFDRDGIAVHLFHCPNPDEGRNMGCYIYVTEIELLYAEYMQAGIVHPNGPLKQMPWGLQFAVIDNNNNIFYFADYKEPVH